MIQLRYATKLLVSALKLLIIKRKNIQIFNNWGKYLNLIYIFNLLIELLIIVF
jgi:hypothetical protein